MRASAERASNFHILKLLFPSIFCWYFWYYLRNTFSGLKVHLHIHTINAVGYYLWYGVVVVYKRQYTDKTLTLSKSMYMRANGASELRHFFAFLHSKTAISFNILLETSDTLSVQMGMLVGLHVVTNFQMYRQNSEKSIMGGLPPWPPPPRLR